MATRERKSQIRINPALRETLTIIAKIEGVPGYELAEKIIIEWIAINKPELIEKLRNELTKHKR
jgi:hypothetical protein